MPRNSAAHRSMSQLCLGSSEPIFSSAGHSLHRIPMPLPVSAYLFLRVAVLFSSMAILGQSTLIRGFSMCFAAARFKASRFLGISGLFVSAALRACAFLIQSRSRLSIASPQLFSAPLIRCLAGQCRSVPPRRSPYLIRGVSVLTFAYPWHDCPMLRISLAMLTCALPMRRRPVLAISHARQFESYPQPSNSALIRSEAIQSFSQAPQCKS